MKLVKNKILWLVIMIPILAILIFLLEPVLVDGAPLGYHKVSNFNYVPGEAHNCGAVGPECGVCTWKLIGEKCYEPSWPHKQPPLCC